MAVTPSHHWEDLFPHSAGSHKFNPRCLWKMSCSYVKPWQAVERESDHLCIWKIENYLFMLVLLHGTWGYCWGIPWGWKKLLINTDTDTDTLAPVSRTQTSLVLFILLSFFFNQVPFPLIPRLLTKDSGHQLLYFGVDPSDSVQSHCVYACAATKKRKFRNRNEEQRFFCQVKNKLRHGPPMNEAHCYS